MIDGRTLTPAELEQVKVSSGTMRGGMGTFYNMKLNGKSIILTTEQRRAIIAEGRDAFQTSDYDQGQLQSAEGDNYYGYPPIPSTSRTNLLTLLQLQKYH